MSYHGQPFASVPIEVSTVEAGNAEAFDAVGSEALSLVVTGIQRKRRMRALPDSAWLL